MILKDIVALLANRINQPHVIECYLRKVYAKGYDKGRKKSPWISVEERLPDPDKEVLLYVKNSILHYVVGWLRINKGYNKSMWALSNGWVEDKDITHWMYIPSFDEILKANRDVLERIKETGD